MTFRAAAPARPWAALALAGLFLLPFLADHAAMGPAPHDQKPMFPVLTRLDLIGEPQPGGTATVLATVQAWAPGETVSWNLDVPPGLTVISGETSWTGTLEAGEVRTFTLAVDVPDGDVHELGARVRIVGRSAATSGASLAVDLGAPSGPRATGRRVAGDGVTYIEYPGEVTPRQGGK